MAVTHSLRVSVDFDFHGAAKTPALMYRHDFRPFLSLRSTARSVQLGAGWGLKLPAMDGMTGRPRYLTARPELERDIAPDCRAARAFHRYGEPLYLLVLTQFRTGGYGEGAELNRSHFSWNCSSGTWVEWPGMLCLTF
jgi:hypothetical protein